MGADVSIDGSAAQRSGEREPEKPLRVTARAHGWHIADVTVSDTAGRRVGGRLSADGVHWESTTPLAAGTRYTARVLTEDAKGTTGGGVLLFRTAPAKKTLNVTFGPEPGVYGVGQPVTARLDRPLENAKARAFVERLLKVESFPKTVGAWHWVDRQTLHYRPQQYWPSHTVIRVHSDMEGLRIAEELYGGAARSLEMTTGDRLESVVDAATRTMTVSRNGSVLRRIPVTTGRPGFATRNGVKVVLARLRTLRMRSDTIGIPTGSQGSFDQLVHHAVHLTLSGEYVHAAPWSQGSQGHANVSHGCIGMSTQDAAWFYRTVRRGDIVEVVHSLGGRAMPAFGNGLGDWNLSWEQWRAGSTLPTRPLLDGSLPGPAQMRPQL